MKRTLLLFLLITAISQLGNAQIRLIPKAGYALYSLKTESNSYGGDVKFKSGFLVGAGLNITINDMFSVQPELLFLQKGWKEEQYIDFGGGDFDEYISSFTLNYLEVPILAQLTFGNTTKFFVSAGPSIGYGIGGKYVFEYNGLESGVTYSERYDSKVKFGSRPDNDQSNDVYLDNALDIGGIAGFGVLLMNKIQIEVRYSLGFTNLVDENPDIQDNTSKNFGFQFNVGVPIGLN